MKDIVVIARYNEDVNWVNKLKIDYLIYNKGSNLDNFVCKDIPNIAYEEYCYLSYIVDFYENLHDRIIFCQADPFIHSPDFLKLTNLYRDSFSDVQPLSWQYLPNNPPEYQKLTSQKYLSIKDCKIHVDFFNSKVEVFSFNDYKFHAMKNRGIYQLFSEVLNTDNVRLKMYEVLNIEPRKIFNIDMTPMCYSAIFSVNKSKILQYPKSYYENLLDLSTKFFYKKYRDKKVFAYIMEFMWLELFKYEPPDSLFNYFNKNKSIMKWWSNNEI